MFFMSNDVTVLVKTSICLTFSEDTTIKSDDNKILKILFLIFIVVQIVNLLCVYLYVSVVNDVVTVEPEVVSIEIPCHTNNQ